MSAARRRTTRAVAGAVAAITAAAGAVVTAGAAQATSSFALSRLAGPDRYATAVAIAEADDIGSDVALLANGQTGHYPDALAGTYLAGSTGAPILLTTTTTLPTATANELRVLGVHTIGILGGTDAVSAGQEQQLKSAGYTVARFAGTTRYDTAAQIASSAGSSGVGSQGGKKTALLASGVNFPDALVSGPASYAAHFPIEITDPNSLSSQTAQSLRSLGIQQVLIVGGTAAVSSTVATQVAQMGVSVVRLAGSSRSGTAVEVAGYARANLGFTDTHVEIARGDAFPDALTGGPHGGLAKAPTLLTVSPTALGSVTGTYLKRHSPTLTAGHVFGGTGAVSDAVVQQAVRDGRGIDTATISVDSTTVRPGGRLTGTVSGANIASVTANGCGLVNQPVADTDTATAGVQFALTVPATQPEGTCQLAFTVKFADGATDTGTVTITVAQPTSVTTRPELVGARIVGTTTNDNGTPGDTSDDFGSTTIRYTFDEPVTGAAPAASGFHAVGYHATTRYDGQAALVETGGRTVLVSFGTGAAPVGAAEVKNLSVATVSFSAVRDAGGAGNPIGDAAIGTGQTVASSGVGHTDAPDLVSVAYSRQDVNGTPANAIVDFAFDQATFRVDDTGFHIVRDDGTTDVTCTASGAGNNGGTTIEAVCPNTDADTALARGYVEAGTVADSTNVFLRTTNPLEAAAVSATGRTPTPDLTGVTFKPASSGGDQVLYTFDQQVFVGAAGAFFLYKSDGSQVAASSATPSGSQVLATFGSDALTGAVGASVGTGAVIMPGGSNTPNLPDEAKGGATGSTTIPGGRTDAPDLVGVSVAAGGGQATYTFDQVVSGAVTAGELFLLGADGSRLTCAAASASGAVVTCTSYGLTTSAASVTSAVLGTADHGAAGATSPAGAAVTTGGNGVPQQ